jgi:hypothetical protein
VFSTEEAADSKLRVLELSSYLHLPLPLEAVKAVFESFIAAFEVQI